MPASKVLQKHSGIYWLHDQVSTSDFEKTAKAEGFSFFQIEGQKLEKKEQLLNRMALAMHFPDYFGNNWDALVDCLTDLSWIDSSKFLIKIDYLDSFIEYNPKHFGVLLDILKEACEYWHAQSKCMIVLFHGKHVIAGLETID